MQHMNIGYNDILSMPTGERRFYLGLLVRKNHREQEIIENKKANQKGKKTVSGETLKAQIKSGQVPLQ